MKKIIVCVLAVAALVSCDNGAKKRAEVLSHERDSLMQVISDKDMELDDIMGVVSEVQDDSIESMRLRVALLLQMEMWSLFLLFRLSVRICSTFRM